MMLTHKFKDNHGAKTIAKWIYCANKTVGHSSMIRILKTDNGD